MFGAIVAFGDWIALTIIGIPAAALWGLLAFVTNYVPNIGFVLGVVPPALLGLLAGGWGELIAVVVVYSLLNFVVQTLIQPRFVGDSVGLSMTVTFIALLFWGWVLGALGALLAIPLTLLVKALLVDVDPRGHWLDALLREEPRAPRTMRARRRMHARRAALASVRRLHRPAAARRRRRPPGRRRPTPRTERSRRPAPCAGGVACGRPGTPCSASRPEVPSVLAEHRLRRRLHRGRHRAAGPGLLRPRPAHPRATWAGTSSSTARSTPPSPSPRGFLGQGAIIFASIWTNATSGFGQALLYTVVFGVLGVVLQAVAFVALDLLTPGRLGAAPDGARLPPREPGQRRGPAGGRGDHRRLDLALTRPS